jgi:NMDA receptor-regulated protein 1
LCEIVVAWVLRVPHVGAHSPLLSIVGPAAVAKHFDDINEDQFDFHNYCVRKVTLRAYVDVLRFEDEAYGQEYFVRAASGIVGIYLRLMDRPSSDDSKEPDYSSMTAAERKKAKAIARKKKKAAEKKDEEEAAAAAAAAASIVSQDNADAAAGAPGTSNGTTNHTSSKPGTTTTANSSAAGSTAKPSFVEEDPLGRELLAKDPADEARKYASMLVRYAPKSLDSWLLCYDVAVRRRKPLLALRALRISQSIDPTSGPLLWRIVDLCAKSDLLLGQGSSSSSSSSMSDPARQVFLEQLPLLLNGKPLESFVKDAVTAAAASSLTDDGASSSPLSSLPYRTCLAKAAVLAGTHTTADACQLIVGSGGGGQEQPLSGRRGASVDHCREALAVLRSFGEGDEDAAAAVVRTAVEQWQEQVQARYPLVRHWS